MCVVLLSITARASLWARAAAISAASDSSSAGKIPSSSPTRPWYCAKRVRISCAESLLICDSEVLLRRSLMAVVRRSEAVSTNCTWRSILFSISAICWREDTSSFRDVSTSAVSRCNSVVAASTSLRVSSMTSIEPSSSAAPRRQPLAANLSPRRVTTVTLALVSTTEIAALMSSVQPMELSNASSKPFTAPGADSAART